MSIHISLSLIAFFKVSMNTVQKPPVYESLKNASISQSGLTVTVDCHADYESDSCVVVYRAYDNSILNVTYGNTVSLRVTLETGNYTFAIFRRTSDNDIDERPFISRMMFVRETETSSSSPPTSSGTGKFQTHSL